MNNTHTGFTLIELMVTIAVIAVVIAIGVPGLNKYAENNRSASVVNLISGTLTLARSEAIKRGLPVIICDSDNATATTPTCNTAANTWSNGWVVFADKNQDNKLSSGDELLAVHDKLNGGLTARALYFANTDKIVFAANGALTNAGSSDQGSIVICPQDKNTKNARAINVSPVGLISLARDTDATPDQIVNDIQKSNVTCP